MQIEDGVFQRWSLFMAIYMGQATCRQEFPYLMCRLEHFSSYVVAVSNNYPEKARDMRAYQATMISEFHRCVVREL